MSDASPAGGPSTAVDIAWNVRNNLTTASEVLERHLATIDRGEADIHTFNKVTIDVAREQAAAVDAGVEAGRDPVRSPGCRSPSRTTCAPGASRRRARRGSSRVGGRPTTPRS